MAVGSVEMLIGCASQRNAELTGLSVQIGALDAQCPGGVGHTPAVLVENSCDVVALERQPRIAQVAGRRERCRRAIEPQGAQEPLDMNDLPSWSVLAARVRHHPFDNPAQLGPNVTTDARHRINLSAVVHLHYGIQVAPFLLYRSALPIFLIDGRDLNKDGDPLDIPTDAYAVASTDPATGKSTVKIIGPCETVNCGRGWAQSQLNLRISKVFGIGRAKVEAIGEVFNLFNAINPSNIVGVISANRRVNTPAGAADATLLQPASFSGDNQRPEQRVGQIGVRFSF